MSLLLSARLHEVFFRPLPRFFPVFPSGLDVQSSWFPLCCSFLTQSSYDPW